MAEDDDGVGGYVIGVPDTVAFEAWCEESWWPALRRRYTRSTFAAETPDARLVATIHDPPTAAPDVVADYPAHLHIDLLPRFQGRGYGRRMMTAMFAALAERGAHGVHLGVGASNTRAIGFYRRLGMAVHTDHGTALIMTCRL